MPDTSTGMGLLLAAVGAVVVGVVVLDAVVTTLAAGGGGGPLTQRLGRWTWQLLVTTTGRRRHWLLSYAGMVVLLVTVLTWVVLLCSGWLLLFASDEQAVLAAQSREPADLLARAYYTAFVVFTLGVGDYVAGSDLWRILTGVATFLGLALITLSITYLISVVSAAVSRRALARTVVLSGETGVDIVRLHWTGSGISDEFASLSQTLSSQILQTTQQHLAYPVLHYFHAAAPQSSAPCALAALDDALVLLEAGLAPDVRPGRDVLTRLRRALEHYGTTLAGANGRTAPQPPPLPDLAPLRDAGVPTVHEDDLARAAQDHAERRCQLAGLVRADAWAWPTGDR